MKSIPLKLFVFSSLLFHLAQGANVLIFMGYLTSHSPTASIQPLADQLARNGHNVTLFSPILIPTAHPNILHFCPPELNQFYTNFVSKFGSRIVKNRVQKGIEYGTLTEIIYEIFDLGLEMCRLIVEHPKFKEFLKSRQMDLVIVDSFMNDCGYPLAHYFKAKTIAYGAVATTFPWDIETFGFPAELSWVPGYSTTNKGGRLSLLDRLVNVGMIVSLSWIYRFYYLPNLEKTFRSSHMDPQLKKMPPIEQLVQNASLMLLNGHYSDTFPKSYPPFVIPIGGMHFEENPKETLSQEVELFIENSDFVYVSFGSFIRISVMPPELLQTFFDAFKRSKLKFLWKWDGQFPQDHPPNILFQTWFPQQTILAHKRLRGFLTQGGQISMTQGICHGVPLIMCPVEGDQDYNALRMRPMGNSIILELFSLKTEELEQALRRLEDDSSLIWNAKRMARACKDRPMAPLDTAIWWIDWVLRTDHKSQLLVKPLSVGQPLWFTWSLDLWALIFISILLVVAIIIILIVLPICILVKCTRRKVHTPTANGDLVKLKKH